MWNSAENENWTKRKPWNCTYKAFCFLWKALAMFTLLLLLLVVVVFVTAAEAPVTVHRRIGGSGNGDPILLRKTVIVGLFFAGSLSRKHIVQWAQQQQLRRVSKSNPNPSSRSMIKIRVQNSEAREGSTLMEREKQHTNWNPIGSGFCNERIGEKMREKVVFRLGFCNESKLGEFR